MSLRTTLAMIGVSLLTSGCQLAWDATTNVVYETCLFTDSMKSKVQYHCQAREAWKEYCACHEGGDYSADFVCGFKAGYEEFLEAGGSTCAPPAPPVKYWKSKYQNAEGRVATEMWATGYREGAAAAKASGARNFIIVPINKCMGPHLGAAVAPPGTMLPPPASPPGGMVPPPGNSPLLPQLPPPVPDMVLPAPRSAPAKTAPAPENKFGSTLPPPEVPQVRQTPIRAVDPQVRQQPAIGPNSVPLRPIPVIRSDSVCLQPKRPKSPSAGNDDTAPLLPIPALLSEKEHSPNP